MFSDIIRKIYKFQLLSPPSVVSTVSNLRLSTEDTLLINCATTRVTPEKIEEALDYNLDWEYIVENAIHHRIAPLLYYNFKKVSDDLVPPKVMKELRETYTEARAHNILATCGLIEILEAFLDAKIKVIVLKGMALAETVYPDMALRPFSDLDLLIFKEDLRKIEAKLSQFGYDLFRDYRLGFAQQFGSRLTYIKENEVSIDLHWHIADLPYSKYIPISSFWENAISVNIEGVETLILSPEDMLIHLCLHFSGHHYSELFWLVDISETIYCYSETIDWGLLLEKIRRYRIHSLMRYILRLVKELFEPPMSAFILEHLSSYKASSFEERLFDVMANPNITGSKGAMVECLLLKGIIPKMRYLSSKLFPSRDFILKQYQHKNIYRSYFLRVKDVLWQVIKTLL